MRKKQKLGILLAAAVLLGGCSSSVPETVTEGNVNTKTEGESAAAESGSIEAQKNAELSVVTSLAQVDMTRWKYQEEENVYWQTGIFYCETPAAEEYETLGIFVPEAYMEAADNGDGTYTCVLNTEAEKSGYTALTAPVVIPVNTPGYSAMNAPTDYVNGVSSYTDAGFVYVSAGCRGRSEGAPAGITDLKAAVRYIRYNEGVIPGSMERIFSFGMSGGGAQSALLGATGDSDLYTPYLKAIGAVQGVSDAVTGSMCWCPITNLDTANEAYEWNLGVSRKELSEDMQQLSDDMAEAFAEYMNALKLKSEDGIVLTLTQSDEGVYQAGTYYDYLVSVVETSLNNFLEDTAFPYTVSSGNMGHIEGGMRPENGGAAAAGGSRGEMEAMPKRNGETAGNRPERGQGGEQDFYDMDGIDRQTGSRGLSLTGTYETVEDYIAALNVDFIWVAYDSATNKASITNMEDFVKACKNASKNVGAFDDLDASQGENTLFGYGDGIGAHFDSIMAELLKDNVTYGAAYAADMEKIDALGNTVDVRMNMYNPLYYLNDYYDGYKNSTVATYWRIRSGINQGDTALSTEVNLALALENYGRDVDFATIWGQGHTMAERTGNSVSNFIEWVNECLK